jgi:hypothetical protein
MCGVFHNEKFWGMVQINAPRTQARGDLTFLSVRLRLGLGAEAGRGLTRLIHRHAFRDEFVPAEQTVDELAHLTIVLKAADVAAATDGRA